MNKLSKRLGHQGTQYWKCGALRFHDQREKREREKERERERGREGERERETERQRETERERNKKENICMGEEKKPGRTCCNEDCHIVHFTI